MKTLAAALLGAVLLSSPGAWAREAGQRNSECFVRPGYWGYAPEPCYQDWNLYRSEEHGRRSSHSHDYD